MLVEVVGAIIWQDGRVLIVRRPDEAEMGGLWEFPGGKVEQGESHQQALQRELREELDIEVEVGPLYITSEHQLRPDRLLRLYFYTSRLISGTPRLLWGQDYRWVLPADLPAYAFPPADTVLIQQLSTEPTPVEF